jgi:hypothetical protein
LASVAGLTQRYCLHFSNTFPLAVILGRHCKLETNEHLIRRQQKTMSEDILYLLFCYLIFGLTLCVLAIRSNNRLKTVIINLVIAGLYGGLLLYNLTFYNSSGSGLVWFVYLMVAIGVHWIINVIGILLTFTNTYTLRNRTTK